jgi:hypothetical protein
VAVLPRRGLPDARRAEAGVCCAACHYSRACGGSQDRRAAGGRPVRQPGNSRLRGTRPRASKPGCNAPCELWQVRSGLGGRIEGRPVPPPHGPSTHHQRTKASQIKRVRGDTARHIASSRPHPANVVGTTHRRNVKLTPSAAGRAADPEAARCRPRG